MIKYQIFLMEYRIFVLACLPSSLDHGNTGMKISRMGEEANFGTWSSTEEGSLDRQLKDSPRSPVWWLRR